MAESTRYQRIVLRMQSPWNYGAENVHDWACKFSLSGAVNCPQPDLEATALDLWEPIKKLTQSHTSLISWDHYPIGSATHDYGMTYTPATHIGDGSGYGVGPNHNAQLEVCLLAECPVGYSSKGRPTFLRKWIHDTEVSNSDPNTVGAAPGANAVFAKWNTGSGPHNLVPVSPTTGVQGGPWVVEPHAFTHQLRRGPKKKVVAAAGPNLGDLSTLLNLLQLASKVPVP